MLRDALAEMRRAKRTAFLDKINVLGRHVCRTKLPQNNVEISTQWFEKRTKKNGGSFFTYSWSFFCLQFSFFAYLVP